MSRYLANTWYFIANPKTGNLPFGFAKTPILLQNYSYVSIPLFITIVRRPNTSNVSGNVRCDMWHAHLDCDETQNRAAISYIAFPHECRILVYKHTSRAKCRASSQITFQVGKRIIRQISVLIHPNQLESVACRWTATFSKPGKYWSRYVIDAVNLPYILLSETGYGGRCV